MAAVAVNELIYGLSLLVSLKTERATFTEMCRYGTGEMDELSTVRREKTPGAFSVFKMELL